MSKKRIISLIVIGVLLSSASVLATYLIESSDVEFDNTTANIPDANGDETVSVQEAIDYLVNNMSSGVNGYVLTYNTQGGDNIYPGIVEKNSNLVASQLPTPIKDGYSFIGWYDAATGGNRITSSTVISENKTIYAHWSEGFSKDSWPIIREVVQAGIAETMYNVGNTKTVSVGTYGDKTVRVANNSHYDCKVDNTELSSKTACGFVVEFAGIITTHNMNSSSTNVGGWPLTSMRSWLNSTLFEALPEDLQDVIADTTVVSGHGSTSGEINFTSTDKLYLLSPKEVDGSNSSTDSASSETRQLDYYIGKNYTYMTKSDTTWCLRTASTRNNTQFWVSARYGPSFDAGSTTTAYGVSPAFRIE